MTALCSRKARGGPRSAEPHWKAKGKTPFQAVSSGAPTAPVAPTPNPASMPQLRGTPQSSPRPARPSHPQKPALRALAPRCTPRPLPNARSACTPSLDRLCPARLQAPLSCGEPSAPLPRAHQPPRLAQLRRGGAGWVRPRQEGDPLARTSPALCFAACARRSGPEGTPSMAVRRPRGERSLGTPWGRSRCPSNRCEDWGLQGALLLGSRGPPWLFGGQLPTVAPLRARRCRAPFPSRGAVGDGEPQAEDAAGWSRSSTLFPRTFNASQTANPSPDPPPSLKAAAARPGPRLLLL